MQAIREFAGQPLIWAQPRAMKQRFELRCGDAVLAVIQWQSSWRCFNAWSMPGIR